MAYGQMTKAEWAQKEKRELFCKAVNSMLMTTPNTDLNETIKKAKAIVDAAFTHYPDGGFQKTTFEDEAK